MKKATKPKKIKNDEKEFSAEMSELLEEFSKAKKSGPLLILERTEMANPDEQLLSLEVKLLLCIRLKSDFSFRDLFEDERSGSFVRNCIYTVSHRLMQVAQKLRKLDPIEKHMSIKLIEADLKLELQKIEKTIRVKKSQALSRASRNFKELLNGPNPDLVLSIMAVMSSNELTKDEYSRRPHYMRENNEIPISTAIKLLQEFYPGRDVKALFHPDSPIFHKQICQISFKDVVNTKWNQVKVCLNRDLVNKSGDDPDFEITKKEKIITPKMSLDDVIMDHENMSDIRAFIEAYKEKKIPNASFLFHGSSGVGKTSLSEAIAKELGMNIVQFSTEGLSEAELPAALNFLMIKYRNSKNVLVFDECESLWYRSYSFMFRNQGETAERGEIKRALENILGVVIFISNVEPPEAFKRRVSYCLKFKEPSSDLRREIFKTRLDSIVTERGLVIDLKAEEMNELSNKYELSGGFFNQAVLLSYVKNPAKLTKATLDYGLEKVSKQLSNYVADTQARVGFSDLSLSNAQVNEFSRIKKYIDRTRAKAQQDPLMPKGTTIFLEGPAGVGKTMVAEAFAKDLGLKFKVVTPSTFLNMYVGQTEKKIAKVFSEAEEDTLLFLDEAEGMLSSRSAAVRSWEKTQIDELLKQIENFKGVFVAATNHKELIDHAFSRRFLFHVKFDYPTTEIRSQYLVKHLGGALKESDANRIAAKHKLSFGEMRNAIIRLKTTDEITTEQIDSELQRQISFRFQSEHKRIGISVH